MSHDKLGFTFYPKDWWTSESYFELNAAQRYIYLECMFIMYSNDGYMKTQKTQLENRLRTQINDTDWELVTDKFILEDQGYTSTTVNKRLRKAITNRENGAKGGRPPKPKKTNSETQNNPPLESERESEVETKGKKNINDIPVFDEVLVYAKEKEPSVCPKALKNKYDSWVENDWKDGNNSKITNWKTKLLNTMPYITKIPAQNMPTKRRIS